MDQTGLEFGNISFIIVDAYSKWIEAHIISSTLATVTIEKLHSKFATH